MGKTSEQTQTNTIDPNLSEMSHAALQQAQAASMIPFMPNRGVRVAAFNPMQEAGFAGANAAASAAGLPTGAAPGMPPVEMLNGIPGYSTGSMYDTVMDQSVPQGMQDYINAMFVDPNTGALPGWATPPVAAVPNYAPGPVQAGYSGDAGQYGNDGRVSNSVRNGTGALGLPNPFGDILGQGITAASNTPHGRALGAVGDEFGWW